MIYNLCTVKSVSRVVWRTGPNVERSVENWAQRLEECGEVGPTSRGVWRTGPNVERGEEKTRKKEVQNICHDHYPYTRRLSSRTDNIIMKAAHSTVRLKMFHFAALIFGPARTRKLRDKNIFLLPLLLLLLLLYRFPIALFPAE